MSKDTIYREDVLRIIDRKTVRGKLQVAREVLKLPSEDVQPVVRCSKCANNYSTPHNPMCDYMDATLYPDSFCSKGKPKGVDCTDCIKNGGDWECDHIH